MDFCLPLFGRNMARWRVRKFAFELQNLCKIMLARRRAGNFFPLSLSLTEKRIHSTRNSITGIVRRAGVDIEKLYTIRMCDEHRERPRHHHHLVIRSIVQSPPSRASWINFPHECESLAARVFADARLNSTQTSTCEKLYNPFQIEKIKLIDKLSGLCVAAKAGIFPLDLPRSCGNKKKFLFLILMFDTLCGGIEMGAVRGECLTCSGICRAELFMHFDRLWNPFLPVLSRSLGRVGRQIESARLFRPRLPRCQSFYAFPKAFFPILFPQISVAIIEWAKSRIEKMAAAGNLFEGRRSLGRWSFPLSLWLTFCCRPRHKSRRFFSF